MNNQDQAVTYEIIYYALVAIAEEYPRNNVTIVHFDFTGAINLKFIIRREPPRKARPSRVQSALLQWRSVFNGEQAREEGGKGV